MADRDPEIQLGAYTERAERLVAGGLFESIDDVVDAALKVLERENDAIERQYVDAVREALANPGDFMPLDQAFAELDERKRKRRAG